MNLSELVFKTNTDDLDKVIKKLDEVGTRVQNLTKIQEKAATDSAKADKAAAAAQDAQNKAAISGIKLEEAKAKAASDTSKTVTESSDRAAAFLQKMTDKLEFMKQGFSSGQASIMAQAKALGILGEALTGVGKNLDLVRKLQGNEPFDKSIGAIKALTNAYDILKESNRLLNAETGLTRKQAQDLARDKIRLLEVAKSEIASGRDANEVMKQYKQTVVEVQSAYIKTARDLNVLVVAEKAHEAAIKNSAQANAFLDKELRRAANAADEANKALGRATSNGLFRFQEALNKSGLTLEQQKKKLDEYKASLAALDKVSGSGGSKTDYISRAIGPQITDIVVGLSTGQSPLTVMLQQGGQLRDQLAMNKVAAADMAATMSRAAREMVDSIKSVAVGMGGLLVNIVKDSAVGIGNIAASVLRLDKAMSVLVQWGYGWDAVTMGATNFGGAIEKLGKLVSFAFGTGILLLITSLIILGVELFKVMQASTGLSQALNLSGASMGTTVSGLKDLAHAMSDTGKTSSYLMEGFTEIAKAGVFTKAEFEGIARSAIDMERYVGVAFKDTVENFKQLKGDPLKALEDLGKATGLVSLATLDNVRSLVLQGKTSEATSIAMKTMRDVNAAVAANAAKDMSPISLAWIKLKGAVANASSAVFDFFVKLGALNTEKGFSAATEDLTTFVNSLIDVFSKLNSEIKDVGLNIIKYIVSAPGGRGLATDISNATGIGKAVAGAVGVSAFSSSSAGVQPSVNIRGTVDAEQGALDTAEQLRAKYSLLASAAQFWGAAALNALTPVQKAQMELNVLEEKAIALSKVTNNDVPASLVIQIDAAIAKAQRVLAAARFAETSPALRPLSSVTSVDYETTKAAYEAEIALLQATEKQKLDILKTSYDENIITTSQYVDAKLRILKDEGDKQLALQAKELEKLGEQAANFNEATIKVRDTLIAAEALSGETPDKVLSRQKKIFDDAEKQMQDFSGKYAKDVEKINEATGKIGLRLPAEQVQAGAEYAKVLKSLAAELDAFNVVEKKHQETLAADKALNSKLLWATEDQVGIIKAQADATKYYIDKLSGLQEAVRKAKVQLDSLSLFGPPDMDSAAYKNAAEVYKTAMNNANEAIATRDISIRQAGVDAAIAYEEQQRAILAGKIADALTTALFEGGRAGSKKLREIIIAELKKPIVIQVQTLVNTLFNGSNGTDGILSSLLGGGGSTGGSGSGGMFGGIITSMLGSTSGGTGILGAIGSYFGIGGAAAVTAGGVAGLGATGTATLAGSTAAAPTTVLAAIPVYGWIALAVIAAAAYFTRDETGIKIDNNTNGVGNPSSHFVQNSLAAYDVSGDLPTSAFAPLINAVNKYDQVLVDALLSPAQTAAIREKLGSLINPDWIGFDGNPTEAISKASKEFLQTRYGAVFDEVDAKTAASIRNFKGNAEELLKYIGETVAVMQLLKTNAADFTKVIGGALTLTDLGAVQKEGESLIQTLDRVVSEFQATNLVAELMGKTTAEAFGTVGFGSVIAREDLIRYAGGLDKLKGSLSFYLENFFTEAERSAMTMKSAQDTLTAGFKELGIAIPTSKEAFKDLLKGIDTTTDAGKKLWATLLALAPALAALIPEEADSTFFKENFYSQKEQDQAALAAATKQVVDGFRALDLAVPNTRNSFRELVESVDKSTTAGLTFYNALIALAPAIATMFPDSARADTSFFKQNFYTEEEQRQSAYKDAMQKVLITFAEFGAVFPSTKSGFRAFVESIDQSTAAGKKFYDAMMELAPDVARIFDSIPVVKDQSFFRSNFYSPEQQRQASLKDASNTILQGFYALGIAIPQSREAFKDLVDSIDTTTAAGVKLKNDLLALAPAIDTVIPKSPDKTFFNANFYSAQEQAQMALADTKESLRVGFAALRMAVPSSAREFRDLVESIDTTTIAGKQLHASLIALAPGIAELFKTADDSFFKQNFYTDTERQASAAATGLKTVTDAFATLGIAMPRTRAEFRAYVESIDKSTVAGKKFYDFLIGLAPAFFDATAAMQAGEPGKGRMPHDKVDVELLAGMAQSSIESLFRTVISSATSAEDARIKGTEAAGKMFFDSILSNLLGQVSSLVMSAIIEPMSSTLLNAARLASVTTVDTAVTAGTVTEAAAVTAGNTSVVAGTLSGTAVVAGGVVAGSVISAAVDKIVSMIGVLSAVFSSPEFRAAYAQFTSAIGTLSSTLYTTGIGMPGYTAPDNSAAIKTKYQEAYNALIAAIDKEKQLAQTRLDLVKAVLDATEAAIKTLRESVEPVQGPSYQEARQFITNAAFGIKNGQLPDVTKYKDAVDSAVNGVMNATYATKFDEQMAKLGLLRELDSIAATLGPQKTDLERQIAYLEQLAATAKLQLDAVLGNSLAILSLADALANWTSVLAGGAATTGTSTGGTPALSGRMGTYFGPAANPMIPTGTTPGTIFGIPIVPAVTPAILPGRDVFSSQKSANLTGSFSTVSSINDTNSQNTTSLVKELQFLREEVIMLRAEVRADVTANSKSAKILDRVTQSADTLRIEGVVWTS